ncbi:U4/U6 small nuclear ribonucleoprotein Prp31 [Chytridiales sp. JEL 0842]|nr:U4/U6 small nuclear ribonucleoprotein Prp31 [Chytridiales sp. JEL 0842]
MDEDLLHDLEELDGDEQVDVGDALDAGGEEEGDAMDGIEEMDKMETDAALETVLRNVHDVKQVAKLLHSKQLNDILQKIVEFRKVERTAAHNTGPIEEDPEYKVLVAANNLSVDVDNEILVVHKFIRDHYAPRFPELESLIPSALDYAKAVKAIGNELDLMKVDLKGILPTSLVMSVTVISTTSNGRPLDDEELGIVMEACDMAIGLDEVKRTIFEYVESRMHFIAPNLCAILGPSTAAKLMVLAGGLNALSKIPACNMTVLGKSAKSTDSGGIFAKGQMKHAGVIYYSDVVQAVSQEYRNKATRMIAAKCCLAARIDRARESQDGSAGYSMRSDIVKKLEKAQEPPPGKSTKALPIPDEGGKKRRAGKRVRRMKERLAMTEAMKAANRMKFGEAEEEVLVGDTMEGMGLIGGSTGKVRTANDAKKVGLTKKHKQLRMLSGSGGATSGLSSSLAFTPIQGIELENPEIAAQKRAAATKDKYFGSSTFFKAPAAPPPKK